MDTHALLLAAAEIYQPLVPLWAMELAFDVFLGMWLFCVGASVGSFLNVVVYRLPRGMNLLYPASRCPSCLHPIRLRDNIPILGWLLLGGRCRDCQARISPRYLVVELIVAGVFLAAWFAEAHFPPGRIAAGAMAYLPHDPSYQALFWCAYGLH
ncbi:MAG TPA: prepilin peptidase, partial [Pirellulaceae bacterium]|nr:prepilin peptidase [Pirellulaceae bacterium]